MTRAPFKIDAQLRRYLLESARLMEDEGQHVKGWGAFKSTYRGVTAYYNKKLGIVVKVPHFILEPRTPLFLRVPTIKLDDEWVAQPLLRKTDLRRALTMLRKSLKPYLDKGIFPDIHAQNVGWYNGKPLLFDW